MTNTLLRIVRMKAHFMFRFLSLFLLFYFYESNCETSVKANRGDTKYFFLLICMIVSLTVAR